MAGGDSSAGFVLLLGSLFLTVCRQRLRMALSRYRTRRSAAWHKSVDALRRKSTMAEYRIMTAERMHDLTTGIFSKLGMPAKDAAFMGDCLVDADLRGVLTHGCRFIPTYFKWI